MNTEKNKLLAKLKGIKLVALDFDGTLTVGAFVIFNQDGLESVICSRRDSLGINMLKEVGIEVVVISKEVNPVVTARCTKMSIKCWQQVKDGQGKLEVLQSHAKKMKLNQSEVCFGGDDVNDLSCIKWAGFGFTVADGHEFCKKVADYTTEAKGGEGAVREICEMILKAQGNPVTA